MSIDRPDHAEVPDRYGDLPPLIDWSDRTQRLEPAARQYDTSGPADGGDAPTPQDRSDTWDRPPADDAARHDEFGDDAPLLDRGEVACGLHLDRRLQHLDVPDLYPSRFDAPNPVDDERLQVKIAENPDPRHWIRDLNPHRDDPQLGATPDIEHRTNCCECARRVQQALWGDAYTARGLHLGGLPLEHSTANRVGEHPAYTERWAGKPTEPTNPADIQRRLESPDSPETSAIVFGFFNDRVGHAFNAHRRPDGTVEHLDGQTGVASAWPPDGIGRYDRLEAIFFTPDDNPHRRPR